MSGLLDSGTRLGPYEIRSLLGRGGMGEVYLALDTRLGRHVAVKILKHGQGSEPGSTRRLLAEAQAASALNHPNIVTVFDVGESPSGEFVVMEYIPGRPFRRVLDETPPSLDETIAVARAIARALRAAHAAGIAHRDIKPDNVILRDDGLVKVLDFGLARRTQTILATDDTIAADMATREGSISGTPRYMAPEQALGQSAAASSDIFSFGVLLYEALAGVHPFAAVNWFQTMQRIVAETPLTPRQVNPAVPPHLDSLVMSMLAKDSASRPTAADVEAALDAPAAASPRHESPLVGRDAERARILDAIDAAVAGHGSLICVAGEPGFGKSTLVDDSLREASATRPIATARGNCSERLAGAEAFLPFLEILDRLSTGPLRSWFVPLLQRLAPSWSAQVLAGSEPSAAPATVARAQREFLRLFEEATARTALVLLIEDVHWSDAATVDLLAYLATALPTTRLVIVATYRPSDLLAAAHPFIRLQQDLSSRGLVREVALGLLTLPDIERYLSIEFRGHAFPSGLAPLIHARTEGNPLFMADLLRYLRDRGVLSEASGSWELHGSLDSIGTDLPASVRSLIDRKMSQLSEADRRLLTTAAVQGYAFDSATLAAALELPSDVVEERLDHLDRAVALIRYHGEADLPDGSLTLRYSFQHVLYQNALYDSLRPTQRVSMSRAVAAALSRAYAGDTAEIDSQLSFLHEAARDFAAAARHASAAAHSAFMRAAPRESVALAERGLALIERLPASPERDRIEAGLLLTIGIPTTMIRGFGAPDLQSYYQRLRELGERTADPPTALAGITGLFSYYGMTADFPRSLEMALAAKAVASKMSDPNESVNADRALGFILAHLGRFDEAEAALGRAIEMYDPTQHAFHTARYAFDPLSASHAFLGWLHTLRGRFAQGLDSAAIAIRRGQDIRDAQNTALAFTFAAFTQQMRGNAEECRRFADMATRLAEERELAIFGDYGRVLSGWARARTGDTSGPALIERGRQGLAAIGSLLSDPHYIGLLADAQRVTGDPKTALSTIDHAIERSAVTSNAYYDAELWRIRGELFSGTEAETCFRRALSIAEAQGAHLFALRAALALDQLGISGLLAAPLSRIEDPSVVPEAREAARRQNLDGGA